MRAHERLRPVVLMATSGAFAALSLVRLVVDATQYGTLDGDRLTWLISLMIIFWLAADIYNLRAERHLLMRDKIILENVVQAQRRRLEGER